MEKEQIHRRQNMQKAKPFQVLLFIVLAYVVLAVMFIVALS